MDAHRRPTYEPALLGGALGGPAFMRLALYFDSQIGICLLAAVSLNFLPQNLHWILSSTSSLASYDGLKLEAPPPPEDDYYAGFPTAFLNCMLYSFHLGILPLAAEPAPACEADCLAGILGL